MEIPVLKGGSIEGQESWVQRHVPKERLNQDFKVSLGEKGVSAR